LDNPLLDIRWQKKNSALDRLIAPTAAVAVVSMNQGFEAEATRIDAENESFVLKLWNKGSRPDVGYQYRLLSALHGRGVAVSEPIGWGLAPNGDQALLTSYDGESPAKVDAKAISKLAAVLAAIHRIPVEELGGVELPKHELGDYFFPGIDSHPDLSRALRDLVGRIPESEDRIIHGDFHLQNIVERDGRFTIIDWTNGQSGDCRYDVGWALVLLRIYASERLATAFRIAYLRENPIAEEELRQFEAIACLRWALLFRREGVPRYPQALRNAKKLVADLGGLVPNSTL